MSIHRLLVTLAASLVLAIPAVAAEPKTSAICPVCATLTEPVAPSSEPALVEFDSNAYSPHSTTATVLDFSAGQNPNGPWPYGYFDNGSNTFRPATGNQTDSATKTGLSP